MRWLFFCIVLLLFLFLFCQCPSHPLPPTASINYFEKGAALFEENIDSALYSFQVGINHYQSTKEWDTYVKCLLASNVCYFIKGDYKKSYAYTQQAYEAAKKYLPEESIAYGSCLNNLALFSKRRGDYDKAIALYQKSLKIEQAAGKVEDRITILLNMGVSNLKKGEYLESKRFFNQALNTRLNNQESDDANSDISHIYKSIADVHKVMEEADTALFFFQKALDKIKPSQENADFWAWHQQSIHEGMAEMYADKKQEKELLQHIHQSNHYCQIAYKRESPKAYAILGGWYQQKKDYPKALSQFEKSIQLTVEKNQGLEKGSEIGMLHYAIANIFSETGQFQKSQNEYQKALSHFSKEDNINIATLKSSAEHFLADPNLLKILQKKASLERQQYLRNKDHQSLKNSEASYQLAIAVLNQLRQSYLEAGSKAILAESVLPIIEGALETNFLLYQQEQSPERFNALFQIAENSKAVLLLESINEVSARGFAGIPDQLLDQEQELKLDIAYYEKQMATTPRAADEKRRTIEAGLFELKEKYQALIQTFEKEYPEYHQLKYNTQIASVKQIQEKLPHEKSALLEYFIGEKDSYLFSISKDKRIVKRFKKQEDFVQQVQLIRNLIINIPNASSAQKDYEKFTTASHALFQSLILPAELDPSIQELIIIPDDILAYLPFEVFLQSKTSSTELDYSPQSLAYLLNDFQISYNYSATLFAQKRPVKKTGTLDFVGFAPSFKDSDQGFFSFRDCQEEELFNLLHNEEEVLNISELFEDGKAILGSAATKSNFQKMIKDYRIAHFATHACLNEDNPMLHKFFLTDDYISNYDLYSLQIPTELVVLSACNTGSGKLSRGEGVMSLSRGFMHAGCPSLLMSLWAVEDYTTSTIMHKYYEGIKAGKSKNHALQDSKKYCLKNAPSIQRHPFFWAAFVQIGDTAPILF